MNENMSELLKCMLAAATEEIESMRPSSVAECASYLGLKTSEEYVHTKHYVMLLAKLRREWAIAMINEANKL